jgi:hypothetical protein
MAIKTFLEKHFHGAVKFFGTVTFDQVGSLVIKAIDQVNVPNGFDVYDSNEEYNPNLAWSTPIRSWYKITDANTGMDAKGIIGDVTFAGSEVQTASEAIGLRGIFNLNNANWDVATNSSLIVASESRMTLRSITDIDSTELYVNRTFFSPEPGSGGTIAHLKLYGGKINNAASGSVTITNLYGSYIDFTKHANTTITNGWLFYGKGDYPSYFGGEITQAGTTGENTYATVSTFNKGVKVTEQQVKGDSAEGVSNVILAGTTGANVDEVLNDANDFIVLPAVSTVPIGHQINICCNASSNFELRTPASSGEKINNVDSDGTQEYLCTDTDLVRAVLISETQGWAVQSITILGAVRTAVVPDV